METSRGLERLVFFTDAVTAIAITLLILPLVDAVPGVSTEHDAGSADEFIITQLPQILSFLLSFAVIARLWVAHHAIFEHVEAVSRRLMFLSIFWAFTIVFLPLPTAMVSAFTTDRLTVGLYIGTMTLSSIALAAIIVVVRRDPALEEKNNPVTRRMVFGSVAASVEFLIALIIGVLFPVINYWALLILLVPDQLVARLRFARVRHTSG